MCGICGFFETAGARVERAALERMSAALAHRGPDGAGAALAEHRGASDEQLRDAPVGLGHRRLAILDLSAAAAQPMTFAGGRIVVAFNGEIVNFRELAAEHFADRTPRTSSDTEILGWAYERWGTDCFRRLDGFFAVAIHDAARGRLVLARDRLGKKPLYLYRNGGHTAFASELRALLAYPHFVRELDRDALDRYLAFANVPGERCIFRHCRTVPAGSWLAIDAHGEERSDRYWDAIEVARRPALDVDDEEATRRLDTLLCDATRARLVSDVPLGAFLSGGVDSSLVAATMCRVGAGRPRTFTIGYADRRFDESRFAAEVAAHLGSEHTPLEVEPAHALPLVERWAEIYDEPFADPSGLPTALLARLTRRHVTVALSGDGGDELFLGYDKYKRALEHARWTWVPDAARRPVAAALARLGARGVEQSRRVAARDEWSYFQYRSTYFSPYEFTSLTGRPFPADHDLARAWRALADLPLDRRMRAVETRTSLADDILRKVDRATMAAALEVRSPLLDHRVVEFALALPRRLVVRGRTRKWLLRRLLYRHVPERLFRRRKMGFRVPLGDWMRGELRPLLLHHLDGERLRRQGLFDPAYVASLLTDHLERRAVRTGKLFVLLAFQLWWDSYHPT